jgi:hypothetical protein
MEIFNVILAAIWFGGVLYWDIRSDYRKWKAKKPINHINEWVLRIFLMVPCVYLLSHGQSIWKVITAALMISSIWWELFDGFYNKVRGFPWRFNGTVDPDDSFLDKILHKLSPLQETLLKWGLIVIFTTLYILI